MYAIVNQSGMQFKVENGKKYKVPSITAEPGTEIEIKDILLFQGNKTLVGRPVIEGAFVKAKVISHAKAPKVIIFKHKRRKRYRKTVGHRQPYTTIEITGMECGTEKV